jgi:ketosteroid isomerase-like protein
MTIHANLDPEAAVLAVLEEMAAAHRARDARALAGLYAPDARLADLAPPLLRRGFDAAAAQAWFDGWDGPVELEFRDLAVAAAGGLALVDGLVRTSARRGHAATGWWARFTAALTRGEGGWRIAHEHVSVPFHMDLSERAALELEPDPIVHRPERSA